MIRLRHGSVEMVLNDIGRGTQVVSLTVDGMTVGFAPEPLYQLTLGVLFGTIPRTTTPIPFGVGVLLDSGDLEALPETVSEMEDRVEITWPIRTPYSLAEFGGLVPNPSIMLVQAVIRIDGDEVVFRVKVDARLTGLPFSLSQVTFPRLRFEPIGGVTTDVLTFPWQQGGLIRGPAQTLGIPPPRGRIFPHPSTAVTMQWFAYYSPGGPMVYLRTTDVRGHRKEMEWFPGGTNTVFALTHYPVDNGRVGGDPDANWTFDMPYDFRITVMRGTWYDAARRYRGWALQQEWAQRGPIASSVEFSSFIRNMDIALVRGRTFDQANESFAPFIEDLMRMKEFFGTSNIATVWADWNYEPFATQFPDYTIKREFADAVRTLAAEGIVVTPYTWRSLWSVFSEAYRMLDGRDRAAQDAFGRPIVSGDPLIGDAIVTIDPIRASSRELAVYHWRRLVEQTGVRALYTDHWSGLPPEIDGNPDLPRTSTSDWQTAKRVLGRMFKEHYKKWNGTHYEDPDFALASEFVDESVIDMIEIASGFQVRGEMYDSFVPAPLYATVYHDYGMVAARLMDKDYTPFTPDPWEIATLYHGGQLLAPINPIDDAFVLSRPFEATPKFESWDFARTLVRGNPITRKYQLLGEKLRPLPGMLEDALDRTGWDGDLMVQGSVWLAGSDIGVLLTNAAPIPRVASVRMRPDRYPFPSMGTLVERDGVDQVCVQEIDGSTEIRLDVQLPPRSLRIFEILPGRVESRVPGYVILQTGSHAQPAETSLWVTEVPSSALAVSLQVVIVRLESGARIDVWLDGSNEREAWTVLATDKTLDPTPLFVGITSAPTAWVRARVTLSGLASTVAIFRCFLRVALPPESSDAARVV